MTGRWQIVGGYECWVKNGVVERAVIGEGNNRRTAYTYRRDQALGHWLKLQTAPATLRKGLKRGNWKIA